MVVPATPVAGTVERHGDLVELCPGFHLVPPAAIRVMGHEVPHQVFVEGGRVISASKFEQLLADDIDPPASVKRLVEDATVKHRVPVQVGPTLPWHDGRQRRRLQTGHIPLRDRVIGHAG